jgi:hypothetical protein
MATINYDLDDNNIRLVRNHASKAAGGYKVQLDNGTELVPRTNEISEYDKAFTDFESHINAAKSVKVCVYNGTSNFPSANYVLYNDMSNLGNVPANNSHAKESFTQKDLQAAIEAERDKWEKDNAMQNLRSENLRLNEFLRGKDKEISLLEEKIEVLESNNLGKVIKDLSNNPEKLQGFAGVAGTLFTMYQNATGGTPAQTVALGGINDMTPEEKQVWNVVRNILQNSSMQQKNEFFVVLETIASNPQENLTMLYKWATEPAEEYQTAEQTQEEVA